MIGPIHQAIEVYAVAETEHVAGLVGHYAGCPPEDVFVVGLVDFLLEETGIVPCEWKDSCSLSDAGQTKYKIPLVFGVQVSECNGQNAECIRFKAFSQIIQYMLSIKLLFFCVLVYTTVYSFQNITLF